MPKIVAHYAARAREIELGSLDVAREFSDVRMVASAYRRLIDTAPAGETFNVCSGIAYSLSEVLAMMSAIAGYEIAVKVNQAINIGVLFAVVALLASASGQAEQFQNYPFSVESEKEGEGGRLPGLD